MSYNLAMTRTIDLSDLPEPLAAAIESMLSTYRAKAQLPSRVRPTPPIGWLKGKWELPDTFFEPLPEDVLDLFDGKDHTDGKGGGAA